MTGKEEGQGNGKESSPREVREFGIVFIVRYMFLSRLREIEMSEHDAELYAKTLSKVRNQVLTLRTMLSSIEVLMAKVV